MSLRAHLWSLDHAPVKNPTAVLVLVALADEADDRGRGACAFIDRIAERARCSKRSAQNHLRDLYRARIISFGDPTIAEQRFKLSAGRCPRVWDLNLDASWESTPEPRTDQEMIETYSDQIGLRPARRGADSAPLDSDTLGGVQNLHPSEENASDQGIQAEVDMVARGDLDADLHPWGAASCTPGVQTAAPYPLGSASTRSYSPPVLGQPLEGAAEPGGGGDSSKDEGPDLGRVARWFAGKRSDWSVVDIESALTIAMNERGVSLTIAAQALRELLAGEDRYGKTKVPYRLKLDEGWWRAVQPKTAAARRQLAAEPRCHVRGHERNPAGRCVPCMTDQYAPDDTQPDPKADARAAAYVQAVRARQRAGELPPTMQSRGRGSGVQVREVAS